MLNDSASQIASLLDRLFLEGDVEHGLESPSPPPHSVERDEETLFLIQKAVEGDETAKELLLDKYKPQVISAVRKRKSANISVSREDEEEFIQDVWRSLFKMLKTYDPNKRPFGVWVHQLASDFAGKWYSRLVDPKRTPARVHQMHPDMEKHVRATDPTSIEFEIEEREFWEKELKPYLENIIAGKEPLPYSTRPFRLPNESASRAEERNRRYHVENFMKRNGLGRPFTIATQVQEQFMREVWDGADAEQRAWILTRSPKYRVPEQDIPNYVDLKFDELPKAVHHLIVPHDEESGRFNRKMIAALKQWSARRGKEKFFVDLMNKAHRHISTKTGTQRAHVSGTAAVLENHLLGLLEILEGWNASDA